MSQYTIKVIYNGIDLDLIRPTLSSFRHIYNIHQEKIILGVASIWDERKGLKYFLQLAQRLDSNYKIVLLGVTKKQKKQLPPSVIGITRTNSLTELAEIYTAANIFVNPTLEEVMGLVNVEALACGTPVITFDTGGSIECIDDKCGLIIPKEDIDKLVNEIQSFDMYHFNEMDCIKKSKNFDKNKKYLEYVDLYIKLLK